MKGNSFIYFTLTIILTILGLNVISVQAYNGTIDVDTVAYGSVQLDSSSFYATSDQLRAASILNECISTLARIEKSDSKIVYAEEIDRLNNVLGWKDLTNYESAVTFRKQLQESLNSLTTISINRERYIKAFERKQNNAAKDAFLNAISGVQLNVNWVSVVSNVLLSSARAYMDYNKRKEDLGVELDEELWQLDIQQRDEISTLRTALMDVYSDVYSNQELENQMSLTIDEATAFYDMLELKDSHLRVQQLNNKISDWGFYTPYWYERGCAYIDLYEDELLNGKGNKANLEEAWKSFAQYEKFYNQCVIYRYDYRTGMIALYKLKYWEGLSDVQRRALIHTVVNNLRNDGNALLYVALEYIEVLNDFEKGFNLMQQLLINPECSAHNEIVLAAGAYWDMLESSIAKDLFIRAVAEADDIDLDAYIAFMSKAQKDKSIDSYSLVLKLQNSIRLMPYMYDEDAMQWKSLKLECDDGCFWFDNREWPLILELADNHMHYYRYDFNLIPIFFEDRFFKSISDAKDMLMQKVKYFRMHPREVEEIMPFSSVNVGGRDYYYLSKKFSDIVVYCSNIDKKSDGNSIKKYDRQSDFQNAYEKFCDKFFIENVEYTYCFSDTSPQRCAGEFNSARYTYKVRIPHNPNSQEKYKYDVELCFIADHIDVKDPYLYFSGIIFNGHYVRF